MIYLYDTVGSYGRGKCWAVTDPDDLIADFRSQGAALRTDAAAQSYTTLVVPVRGGCGQFEPMKWCQQAQGSSDAA